MHGAATRCVAWGAALPHDVGEMADGMTLDQAKRRALSMGRAWVPSFARFAARQTAAWWRANGSKAWLWRWQFSHLPTPAGASFDLVYFGRKESRPLAMALLDTDADHGQIRSGHARPTACVSELPMPGALRVPAYLHAVVPLCRPLEEIVSEYPENLRRILRRQRAACHTRRVVDDAEIDRLDREMIRPYAVARHGDSAAHVDTNFVRDIAKTRGRLTVVMSGTEAVGCHLGYPIARGSKRRWLSIRFGFPEAVFSDRKRLREINSINTYFELEAAHRDGLDHYDIGDCLARPDDGLLQWKSARGGHLDTSLNHAYFYVRLPKRGAAEMLWHSPLFAQKRGGLTLHLGLPAGRSDHEATVRYRDMRFGGLRGVCLHHARPPGQTLLDSIRGLFANSGPAPVLQTMPVQS